MTITQLGDLAQWLQVAQSVVAIIGFPILILTLLMIWRQAQYTWSCHLQDLQRLLVLWAAYVGGAPPGPACRAQEMPAGLDITTPELKEAW
jgi:hypothetical protein